MKQYKYRGWPWLLGFVAIVVAMMVLVIFCDRAFPGIALAPVGKVFREQYVRRRKMTEAEWKRHGHERDERYEFIAGKAARIAWWVSLVSVLGGMLFAALMGEGYRPVLWVLAAVLVVHSCAYLIAQKYLEKRA